MLHATEADAMKATHALPRPTLIRCIEVELSIDGIVRPISLTCVFTHHEYIPPMWAGIDRCDPAEPEHVTCHAAYLMGTDIQLDRLLSDEQIQHIESLLLDEVRG